MNVAKFIAGIALGLATLAGPALGGVNSWTTLNAPVDFWPGQVSVHPANPNIIFIARYESDGSGEPFAFILNVHRTVDGGATWEKVYAAPMKGGASTGQVVFDPFTPSTVYLVGAANTVPGAVYRSTNGGTDWTLEMQGLPASIFMLTADSFNQGVLYATSASGLFKTTNRGESWSYSGPRGGLPVVDPASGNLMSVMGSEDQAAVLRSTDSGMTWATITTPGPVLALAFEGANGVVYAGKSLDGQFYKSTDGGLTWTNLATRVLGPQVSSNPPNSLWVRRILVGSGSPPALLVDTVCGAFKSLDGGLTFSSANEGLPLSPGSGANCHWSVGQSGLANSAAAPNTFVAAGLIIDQDNPVPLVPLFSGATYTLDAALLKPVCSLAATTTVAGHVALAATCSPTATSYVWSANTGFASSASGGTVIPTQTTTYTVQGVNANGASSVESITVTAPSPRAVNLATRGQVLTGDNVLIAGFAIEGPGTKSIVVRARGPSLAANGIAGSIANPTLRLMAGNTIVRTNDDWQAAAEAPSINASGYAPAHAQEAAMFVSLPKGLYTAVMSGSDNSTGVGIVEVFEVDRPEMPLVNIATRGLVETGDNVMIAGFVINGTAPVQVVVRARGPSLAQFNVAGTLADPVLKLFSGQTEIGTNDDWPSAPNSAQVQSLGFAPADPKESAILITLDPGAYTAIMSGAGSTTGVGIVEVFVVP
jgi:hypothetical protein